MFHLRVGTLAAEVSILLHQVCTFYPFPCQRARIYGGDQILASQLFQKKQPHPSTKRKEEVVF